MSYGHSFSDRLDISVGLFKASSAILLKNRSLLLFPLISALAALLVLVSFAWPSGGMRALTTLVPDGKAFTNSHYAAYFLFYLCEYFVVFFFNTALVGAVMRQLDGEEATFTDGLRIAASKLYTIFGYALISATVGVVLQAIEERSGWLGRIVASLLGTTWTLATYFVVPVLAANDVGPIEAVKESAQLGRDGARRRRHGLDVRDVVFARARGRRGAHRTREIRLAKRADDAGHGTCHGRSHRHPAADLLVAVPNLRGRFVSLCERFREHGGLRFGCARAGLLRSALIAPPRSEADPEPPIEIGQQPQRTDHQELHVLEERGPLALDRVTDELADPCDGEQHGAHEPQRSRSEAIGQHYGIEQRHQQDGRARREPDREPSVIDDGYRDGERSPIEQRMKRARGRHRPQQREHAPDDDRHANPVDTLVDGIAMALAVVLQPSIDAAHFAGRYTTAAAVSNVPPLRCGSCIVGAIVDFGTAK